MESTSFKSSIDILKPKMRFQNSEFSDKGRLYSD